jgi:hypothetical protein
MIKQLKFIFIKSLPHTWRDNIIATKRYSFSFKKEPLNKQMLIVFIDGKFWHGGFCDRFKGIVSLYHFALVKGLDFRLCYNFPFHLNDFLEPNKHNWLIDEADICHNYFNIKYMNLVGDNSLKRLRKLKTNKQIHCYANRDIVDNLNQYYKTNFSWDKLFGELFKPTPQLSALIAYHKNNIGSTYVCAVYRFQQLLGDFVEYDFPELNEQKKELLIKKMLESITQISSAHLNMKILVTSDSGLFLNRATSLPNVYILPGKVVHIDNVINETHDVYLKSFLDFFMIAGGEKVYSIGTSEMYKTEFPLYAAKLNNVPFERICIK